MSSKKELRGGGAPRATAGRILLARDIVSRGGRGEEYRARLKRGPKKGNSREVGGCPLFRDGFFIKLLEIAVQDNCEIQYIELASDRARQAGERARRGNQTWGKDALTAVIESEDDSAPVGRTSDQNLQRKKARSTWIVGHPSKLKFKAGDQGRRCRNTRVCR